MPRLILLLLSLLVNNCFSQRGVTVVKKTPDSISNFKTALVIGNASYNESRLNNPVNDATDFANTLKSKGFTVILKTDASLKQMVESINQFGSELSNRKGIGLFYFSGHGMQVGGENYLLPVNASINNESDVEFEAVSVGRILGKMNDAYNNFNIVILDACRNNPFNRSFRSTYKGLSMMNAPSGTFISYATSPGSVASDGDKRNSPFTAALVNVISNGNLELSSVFKEVTKHVKNKTNNQQVPWVSSSLDGDFYFDGVAGNTIALNTGQEKGSQNVNTRNSDESLEKKESIVELPDAYPKEIWKVADTSKFSWLAGEWFYPSLPNFFSRFKVEHNHLFQQNEGSSPEAFKTEWVETEVFISNKETLRLRYKTKDWPGTFIRIQSGKPYEFYNYDRFIADDGTVTSGKQRLVLNRKKCKITKDGMTYSCE